jgi:DNA-binding response OmpR family regulator
VSVALGDHPPLPGCGPDCAPRGHDPLAHEAYGLLLGRLSALGPPTRVVRTGPLAIDLDARSVTVQGHAVSLSLREWALLAHLAEHLGRWCDPAGLILAVFGPAWAETDRLYILPSGRPYPTNQHALNVLRHRLRKKLGASVRGLLVTNPGRYAGCRLERREPIL